MATIEDTKKLTKTFIYDIYFKLLVQYDDYYDDTLYEKLTRKKMVTEVVNYYNNDISNIYNILTDDELDFLHKFMHSKNNVSLDYYHDIYDTLLISCDSKLNYSILDELKDSITQALRIYKENKIRIEKEKKLAYLIVGLVRSYGALKYEELVELISYYNNIDVDEYLNHPYVNRYVNTKSNIIKLYKLYYECDYEEILKSHSDTFKTLYPYDKLINIGKHYFDISDDKYKLLKKDIQAYDFVMQDKEEFIIRCGLGLLVDYVNNNLRLYFYNDESLRIILNFGSSLPTFELNDNSLDVMDNEFVKDFYALIPHFYKFVAKELSIKLTQNIDNTLDSSEVYEILSKLDSNKTLIDKYIELNKNVLSDADYLILDGFKNGLFSDFMLYKHLKNGSIFIDSKTNKMYLVKGLLSHINKMIPETPSLISTHIFPCKNNIICSGIINQYPVVIGPNIKRQLNELYSKNKNNIIKS